ncbi:MAG: TPM domain-containing protein [Lysobacter sp.]
MRVLQHLFAPSSRRWFPPDRLQRITEKIVASEQCHQGEICFAVEPAMTLRAVLAGQSARERAHEVFAQLRVWDTRGNTGVLLYLLLAEHRIELVVDRGFDGVVEAQQWRDVCQSIEQHLTAGDPETAIVRGVEALSVLLAQHFPRVAGEVDVDELPNQPHLLG